MIYITIIIVAIIIAGCVLGCKYISYKFNPDMYEQVDVTNVSRILQDTLHRCYKYEHTTGDDKYKYSMNEQEIARIMRDIAYSLNITVIEDVDYE